MIEKEYGEWGIIDTAEQIVRECSKKAARAFLEDTGMYVEAHLWECKQKPENIMRSERVAFDHGDFFERKEYTPQFKVYERRVKERFELLKIAVVAEAMEFAAERAESTAKEAEKIAAEASTEPADPNPLNLPPRMNTERARKYIHKAIEAGYIKIKEQSAERDGFVRYKWVGLYKQILAYFMYEIYQPNYNPKEEKAPPQPPVEEIEETFGVGYIPQKNRQARESTDANTLRQRETIDKLFKD